MKPTLYQTFKQQKPGLPPVFIQVIQIVFKEGERVRYDLLNLDGKLNTTTIFPADFIKLMQDGILVEWVPSR